MRRHRNVESQVENNGSVAWLSEMVQSYIFGTLEGDYAFAHEIDFEELAKESSKISPNTALHKVLYTIANDIFYLCLYDDISWCDEPKTFANYVVGTLTDMNLEIPQCFLGNVSEKIFDDRRKYDELFCSGLDYIVESTFASLWTNRHFLYSFNLKMSEEVPELIGRVGFPKWVKDRLKHRERGRCYHCGCLVCSSDIANNEYDIDHVIPLAEGGTNDPTNLALSCPRCNRSKQAKIIKPRETFDWPSRLEK